IHVRIGALVENLLPLPDHPEIVVIHNDDLEIGLVLDRSRKLLRSHLKPTVADKRDHLPVRMSYLSSKRGGESKAHCSETARSERLTWSVERIVLGQPHLMLTDIGGNDRITASYLHKLFDQVLRHDRLIRF